MAIPAGVARVAFSGTSSDGEIFQWGFWLNDAPISPEATSSMAGLIKGVWANVLVRLPIVKLIKNDSAYTKIKVYSYLTGGPKADFVGEASMDGSAPGAGTGVGNGPLYQCMVVSTHTGLSGRSHNGRFYLPASGTALSTTHRFETTDVNATAAAVGKLLELVADISDPTLQVPVVLSQFLGSATPITSITVDSKPDVQRRRENRMAPGFTALVTLP